MAIVSRNILNSIRHAIKLGGEVSYTGIRIGLHLREKDGVAAAFKSAMRSPAAVHYGEGVDEEYIDFDFENILPNGLIVCAIFRARYDKLPKAVLDKLEQDEHIKAKDIWKTRGGFIPTDSIHEVIFQYAKQYDDNPEAA